MKAWGEIVKRILNYPKTDLNTPVNYVCLNKKKYYIQSRDVMILIRSTVALIGRASLGFDPDDVASQCFYTLIA